MNPHHELREAIAAGVSERERELVAWRRAEERTHWERLQRRRGKQLGDREYRSRREWAELYERQGRQRSSWRKTPAGCWGAGAGGARWGAARVRRGAAGERESARTVARGAGAAAPAGAGGVGKNALRGGAGDRARGGRSLPKRHGRVGGTGRGGGEDGRLGRPYSLRSPIDHWKLRSFAEQERLQQVREVEGEAAYQERRRAWEKANQPLVPSRFPSDRPQHRGPEQGGPERDSGPSR